MTIILEITSSDLTLDKVKMNDSSYNGLFTKGEVKMAGYWRSFFLHVCELSPGPKFVNCTCKTK